MTFPAIRFEGDMCVFRAIKMGIRPGFVLSTNLFWIFIETILGNMKPLEGIKFGGHNVNIMR